MIFAPFLIYLWAKKVYHSTKTNKNIMSKKFCKNFLKLKKYKNQQYYDFEVALYISKKVYKRKKKCCKKIKCKLNVNNILPQKF